MIKISKIISLYLLIVINLIGLQQGQKLPNPRNVIYQFLQKAMQKKNPKTNNDFNILSFEQIEQQKLDEKYYTEFTCFILYSDHLRRNQQNFDKLLEDQESKKYTNQQIMDKYSSNALMNCAQKIAYDQVKEFHAKTIKAKDQRKEEFDIQTYHQYLVPQLESYLNNEFNEELSKEEEKYIEFITQHQKLFDIEFGSDVEYDDWSFIIQQHVSMGGLKLSNFTDSVYGQIYFYAIISVSFYVMFKAYQKLVAEPLTNKQKRKLRKANKANKKQK